jgi:DNA-binding NarL/FixJ family response regulator
LRFDLRLVTLILADDHRLVRESIRAVLDRPGFAVVAEAGDGVEAVTFAERFQPDVILLDLSMPQLDGIAAIREIAMVSPNTKPILLTMHTSDVHVLLALRSGARGFVLKSQSSDDLVDAIREVHAGRVYLSPHVAGGLVKAYVALAEFVGRSLTPRERQIVQLVADGKTTRELASILGIEVGAAKSQRTRVMAKLGVRSAPGVVRYAVRWGLIPP